MDGRVRIERILRVLREVEADIVSAAGGDQSSRSARPKSTKRAILPNS